MPKRADRKGQTQCEAVMGSSVVSVEDMNKRSHARQRADRTDRETVENQIQTIADLMSADRWIKHKTERELSAQWGVGISVVRHRAAEASRRVRWSLGDKEKLRQVFLDRLQEAFDAGMTYKQVSAAVQAVDRGAQIAGLITQKVEAKVGAYAQLSDAELEERILEEARRIEAKHGG